MAEALDNLGRKINDAKMTIGELKGLIGSLMSGKVGAAKPVGGAKETSANGSSELVKLFEKYVKNYDKENNEQKNLLQKVLESLDETKKRKSDSKKEGKEKKEDKKESIVEKLSKIIGKKKSSKEEKTTAQSTKSLEKIFGTRGSGYTHDVYCERFLKSIYEVLSKMASAKGISAPSAQDIEDDIKKPSSSGSNRSGHEDLLEEIEDLEQRLSRATKGRDSYLYEGYEVRYENIWDVIKGEEELIRLRESGNVVARRNDANRKRVWREFTEEILSFEKIFLGFEKGSFTKMFEGAIEEERKFTQQIRQAAYETAGVTSETQALQRTYENIGKTAALTGVNRSEFQKAFTEGLRSGVKDQKKLNSLIKTQLNTEKQIGVEAGSLGDQFIEYGNSLKFNNDQISEVGRGIREAGRSTGLVGEKLKGVVSSSKQFVDAMKNAGTATSSSVSNVVGLKAQFEKLGVSGDKLLGAISSTTGFLDADPKTLALVANAAARGGVMQEMWNGTILKSTQSIKSLNKGIISVANGLGLSGSNAQELKENFDNLSDAAKKDINMRLKFAYGVEAGELTLQLEALENQSKTLAEKLSSINKEKSKNITLEEKSSLLEEERNLKLGASLKALTAISEAAKGTDSMSSALAKFGRRRGEFEEDIAALGQSWTNETDVARAAIKGSLDNLNAGLKKAGKSEVKIDSSRIEKALKDPTSFRELTEEINNGEKLLATAQKAQLDPLNSIDQTLLEINDGVRSLSQGIISGIFNSTLGKILIAIVALGAFFVTGFATIGSFITKYANMLLAASRSWGQSNNSYDPMGGVKKAIDKVMGKKETDKGSVAETMTEAVKANKTKDVQSSCCDSLLKINQQMLDVLKSIQECVCKKITTESRSLEEKASATMEEKRGNLRPVTADAALRPATTEANKAVAPVEKVDAVVKKENKKPKLSLEEIASRKAAGQAAKEKAETSGISPSVAKSIKRQEVKNIKADASMNKIQRKNLIQEIQNGKRTRQIVQREQQAAKGPQEIPQAPETGGFDLNKLISGGKDMAKSAVAVAILGLGAVALGAAIVFLSKKILGAFDLDTTTILQTAGSIAALAVAGGAIAAAGMVAYNALSDNKESKEFAEKSKINYKDIVKQIAAIVLLGPALVLLGATIVKLSQMVVSGLGLDMATVAETAGTVAMIIASAGALTLGASEALEGFEKMDESKLMKNPLELMKTVGRGALAIAIMGPALVLLSAALIKTSQLILSSFNLDATTIATVSGQVAALIAGAGVIALAVSGAVGGLMLLEKLSKFVTKNTKNILVGATALMLIAPPIVFLAAALNKMISGVLGAMGVDAGEAARVAYDVAALIGATALIALGVVGALAGLSVIGSAFSGPQALGTAWLMTVGAAALMVITPAIILLASALNSMISGIMGYFGVSVSKSAEVAYGVAAIIGSAAAIAIAVVGALAGLAGLGLLATSYAASIPLMMGGAAALFFLTPAVLYLSEAILRMADSISGGLMKSSEGERISKAVAGILGAASSVALSVLLSVAGLSVLGLFFASAMLAIPLMWLGTKAFNALVPPIITFIEAIKNASQKIGGVISPSQAESMSEGVATILNSVAKVTERIASTQKTLRSVPVYGGFWNWLKGSTVSEVMYQGVDALRALSEPVVKYVEAIANFARKVGTTISPRQAAEMAVGIEDILCAVGGVTKIILNVKDRLSSIKSSSGWGWFKTDFVKQMEGGAEAIGNMSEPVVRYVATIVGFARKVGNTISPRQAAEMAVGVEDILCAVGGVTSIILNVKNRLSSIKSSSGWGWFKTDFVKQMEEGASALNELSGPVVKYVAVIKKFAKKIGRTLPPRQAADMARGVASVIEGTGSVTEKVMETKNKISGLKASGWGIFRTNYVKKVKEGTKALTELKNPITGYVVAIKEFAQELGSKLNVTQAASMANGVANILAASGDVTERIMQTKEKLMTIKSSEGFWLWATDIPKVMTAGVKALGDMKKPIVDYITTIIDFSLALSKTSPAETKKSMKAIQDVSSIVDVFSKVLNELKDKITPLTKSGWFTDSPIEGMVKAKAEMDKFFPVLNSFIISIVEKVNSAFKGTKDLTGATRALTSIAKIFEKINPIIETVKNTIIPMTKGKWFGSSDVESIKSAIPKFNGFFQGLAQFIYEGIVLPVTGKLQDEERLRAAGVKLRSMSKILKETGESVSSLSATVSLIDDGFFTKSPVGKIMANKDKFKQYFEEISKFISSGVVDPIEKISGSDGLIKAKDKLINVGNFLCSVKLTLESLAGVFSLMESDSVFKSSPLKIIDKNKEEFKKYFISAANFVSQGLVGPAMLLSGEGITVASSAISKTSNLVKLIPGTIKGLFESISLATDPTSFGGDAPMKKIVDSKDLFAKYFTEIANFIKEGIVNPVEKELKDVNIGAASKTMSSMASIVASITPIIKNLSGVMGLMSGETKERLDTDFAIDKILEYKNLFSGYFRDIAIFLRDGIINPVQEVFPDPKGIKTAASTLSSISNVITLIPRVIKGLSEGVIPLVEAAENSTKEVPMDIINRNTKVFSEWFTNVALFMKNGIIDPILGILKDPKEIQTASQILSRVSSVLSSLSGIIKNLASMFGGLNASECTKSAPAAVISSQAEIFSGWFRDVIGFLKYGIITPINTLIPDPKELTEVRARLSMLTKSITGIPDMFDELAGSISLFSKGFLWKVITGFKISKLSGNFIYMAQVINDGIIKPIQKFLPGSSELSEVNNQLNEFIDIVDKIAYTMGLVGQSFLGIKPISIKDVMSMKEGMKTIASGAVSEKDLKGMTKSIEAKAIEPISFGDKEDIRESTKDAKQRALAELSKKLGKSQLSGVEYEIKVNKDYVEATAKWSKEKENALLVQKKKMEDSMAGASGVTGSNMQMTRPEPAQAATQSIPKQKEYKSEASARIMGRTATAEAAAYERAAMLATEKIEKQLGYRPAGIDIEELDVANGMAGVRATWSKESEKDALTQAAKFNEMNASQGGQGRSGIVIPQQKENSLEKVMEKAIPGTSSKTITTPEVKNDVAPSPAVSSVSPSTATKANIEQKMMQEKASVATSKSEIVSPELGALTAESEEQTELLTQMKNLFEQFVALMQPKSSTSTASGGDVGSTASNSVVAKPTNFYPRVGGNFGQTPGKAIVNLGAKALR